MASYPAAASTHESSTSCHITKQRYSRPTGTAQDSIKSNQLTPQFDQRRTVTVWHCVCSVTLLGCCTEGVMSNRIDSYYSCIVIGAGCAGLYAAQQLKQQFPDLLVVEAQNHVGGRIRQVRQHI